MIDVKIAMQPHEFAPLSSYFTYEEAAVYCQFLDYNGHTDWRMPTYEEYTHTYKNYGPGWYLDEKHTQTMKWPVRPIRNLNKYYD